MFNFLFEMHVLHVYITIAIDWRILQDATDFPR